MMVSFTYLGRSALRADRTGQTLSLAPNLARDPVAFDAPLFKPLRFREAISVLHDIVISDLRFRKKDRTAYLQWKQQQEQQGEAIRRQEFARLSEATFAQHDVPPDLEQAYRRARKRYWSARQQYGRYLLKHDPHLWRRLMPCDPVITVAEDVLFFECFSADESSYGCLTVDRSEGFGQPNAIKPGTTNVDYSWDLYHHFQALRSYRQTRFHIDPAGFEVKTQGSEDCREEKIDLPSGWLRGFMELQGAMSLPMVRLSLPREVIYSILAWLKRHRTETSPRGVRFDLVPGSPPRIILEPWEQPILSHGAAYEGPPTEPIRIWGRRRLLSLARLLPLAERFDVYLLGTGLPSFWVVHMGEMRLTLGLSGWTANDWTRGSAIDLVSPPAVSSPEQIAAISEYLHTRRAAPLSEIAARASADPTQSLAALRHLAHAGQVICDLSAGIYRWRQIMPRALGEAEIGPPHPELIGARQIMAQRPLRIESRQEAPRGGLVLTGNIDGCPVEVLMDAESNIRRGRCVCGYYRKYLLRNGPCRHMLVMRRLIAQESPAIGWAKRMKGWV